MCKHFNCHIHVVGYLRLSIGGYRLGLVKNRVLCVVQLASCPMVRCGGFSFGNTANMRVAFRAAWPERSLHEPLSAFLWLLKIAFSCLSWKIEQSDEGIFSTRHQIQRKRSYDRNFVELTIEVTRTRLLGEPKNRRRHQPTCSLLLFHSVSSITTICHSSFSHLGIRMINQQSMRRLRQMH